MFPAYYSGVQEYPIQLKSKQFLGISDLLTEENRI